MDKEKRIWYYDYLRVFAIVNVMLLHISGSNWEEVPVTSFAWQAFNILNSLPRFAVPVFVMISGALFLGRDIPIKKIYSKYVLRLVTAFIFWSLIYMLFYDVNLVTRMTYFIKGHYHMWFIPMIICLYIIIPFLKPITDDKNKTKYFLIVTLIFAFIIPFIIAFTGDFFGKTINSLVQAANKVVTSSNMKFVMGYTGYFVLGYVLHKVDFKKRDRYIIYIIGILGFILTIGLDLIVALKTNEPCSHYYSAFSVNVLMASIGVFTWFKYRKYEHEKLNKIILKLSKYSFGAYLAHALVIEQSEKLFGLNTLSFNPVLAVLAITVMTAIISFIISAIINHIPILKKYVV